VKRGQAAVCCRFRANGAGSWGYLGYHVAHRVLVISVGASLGVRARQRVTASRSCSQAKLATARAAARGAGGSQTTYYRSTCLE
jgi:hypothetical protein